MTSAPRLTIVVADDSLHILELLALVLARASHRVVTARDGAAAWEAIRAHRPRVAILDVEMPRLGGAEVAALVRESPELAGTRVLLLSGHAGTQASALAARADGWLNKPFRPRELLDAVSEVAAE